MLISGVSEEEGREGPGAARNAGDYQTADELFELMVKHHGYNVNDDQSLSTSDLVILYKNIDVGTNLISNANELRNKMPNQHVETVVHKDESDESDLSENYSNEDLQDMYLINNERIDLINNMPCIQHKLCHKVGDIKFQSSNLATEYDKQFLFKDPYINHQLKNISLIPECMGIDTILPASLLDYICCKRLEDNYNFYMDNIIRYVQHTIEQLKRISNGDYLTDRAKEKWREVAKDCKISSTDAAKVLATSASIPLHVEAKHSGHRSTWDDIVHSEVDIRSLSKILEKKIIIEIPKLICGSYRLFSERRADNLIISCKKDINYDATQNNDDSRVDVVFKLKRSDSGHVMSNINSIMILQNMASLALPEPKGIQYQEMEIKKQNYCLEERAKIFEIEDQDNTQDIENMANISFDTQNESISERPNSILSNNFYLNSSQSSIVDKGILERKVSIKTFKTETDFTLMTPDELRCTVQRLNMQTPVPEETEEACLNKKKSPTRIRVKSPYENKSLIIEEKKRKKLLEIREKRERKKMALSENCKITKHKYGKGAIMAQPSSSVTKLSITNKSFYNSIYGESSSHEEVIPKKLNKWQRKAIDFKKGEFENELHNSSFMDKSSLDDVDTETAIQMHQSLDTENFSSLNNPMSSYKTNVNLLSNLITSSGTDCSISDDLSPLHNSDLDEDEVQIHENNINSVILRNVTSQWSYNCVQPNVPKSNDQSSQNTQQDIKKTPTPVECRKSIDKIYHLMKKLEKLDENEKITLTNECISNNDDNINHADCGHSSVLQVSDSGTSIKHHLISSNPSSFSSEKSKHSTRQTYREQKREAPAAVIPKVIISAKLQTSKLGTDRSKTDRRRNVNNLSPKVPDNPLKAISQLLHEFENVQKTRQQTHKKRDNKDSKSISRQGSSKKPRQEQIKDPISTPVKILSSKEKRNRAGQVMDGSHMSNQITYDDNKHPYRNVKRISDIIDEAKEARGEAVRGPSKPYSRLNTLAQPKKSYIQAHIEEYQIKNVRNIMAHRLQRPTTSSPVVEKNTGTMNAKNKRKGLESTSVAAAKPIISTVPPIERIMKTRRSPSNSPVRKRVLPPSTEPSCKQSTVPETSENLKKKMMAVESYVKNHYGPINTNKLSGNDVHKSRVPLIPNDIEIASLTSSPTAEESAAIGEKIHYMIDTMINSNVSCLSVLNECKESTSRLSNDDSDKLLVESLLKTEESKSESDYPVDIFDGKNIVTAVESVPKDEIQDEKVIENSDTVDAAIYNIQPFNSAIELRKIENSLYQKISLGAFPKRLKIKNLTLTPKQSLQQKIIVVQSGDASSILVKPSVSQSLQSPKHNTSSFVALKPLTTLSNTHMTFGLTNLPMQVATIGYAFPKFPSIQNTPISSSINTLHQKGDKSKKKLSEDVGTSAYKLHEKNQSSKGVYTESCLEQSTQANIIMCIPPTCNITTDTSEQKEKKEIDSEKIIKEKCNKNENNSESSIVLSDITEDTIKKETTISDPSDNIDHSTSLGILMGLMNEIRKITEEANNKTPEKESHQCQELEVILNNTGMKESSLENNCRDLLSVTSIDKLEQIEQKTSSYSYKLLKNIDQDESKSGLKNLITYAKPQSFDKEVSVCLEKQYEDKLTDVPSCFLFINTNYISNFTDSVIQVEPLTSSVYSVANYETLCRPFDEVLEFPKNENVTNVSEPVIQELKKPSSSLSLYSIPKCETPYCNPPFGDVAEFKKIEKTSVTSDKEVLSTDNIEKIILHNEQYVKIDDVTVFDKGYKCASKILSKTTSLTIGSEFDPIMKIKRDVLVTVYSILVFTVFAALSFPKVFYQFDV